MACCFCRCCEGENEYIGRWKFYLTIVSANNLPNVRKVSKTRAYAKIYVGSNGEKTKHRTDSDNNNGLNPAWHHSIAYETAESCVLYYGMTVTIKLYAKRTMGDRYIGEASKPLKDLFEERSEDGSASLSLPIMKGSVKAQGNLRIDYSFEKLPDVLKSHFKKKGRGSLASFTKDVAIQTASQAIYFAVLAATAI